MANYKRKKSRLQPGGCFCKSAKLFKRPMHSCIDPPEEVAPHRSRKNRKKWCRGKVGVEHEPEWVTDKYWKSYEQNVKKLNYDHQNYTCTKCEKILASRTIHRICGKEHGHWRTCEAA